MPEGEGFDLAKTGKRTKDVRWRTRLQVRADARPECIRPLRDAVASLASETGLSSVQVYAVKFCVGEAIANAVKHAYPESEPGRVDVSAQEVGDELVVTVVDHGRRRVNQRTHTEDEGFARAAARGHGLLDRPRSGANTGLDAFTERLPLLNAIPPERGRPIRRIGRIGE